MKFSLWMFISIAIVILALSFPEMVPFWLRLYGIIFCFILLLITSDIFINAAEKAWEDDDYGE